MELLLNLIWLALALPAFWMWRRMPVHARNAHWFGCCRPFLLLACALVLLFPVISATDDLHAMRPEVEESNPFNRQLKNSAAARSGACAHASGIIVFHATGFAENRNDEPCGVVSVASSITPESSFFREQVSRGPPGIDLS
jgi:hypothetical protein